MSNRYREEYGDLELIVQKHRISEKWFWEILQDRQDGRPLILASGERHFENFKEAYNHAKKSLLWHVDNYLFFGEIIKRR